MMTTFGIENMKFLLNFIKSRMGLECP